MRDMDGRSIMDIKWSEEAGIGCTRKCLYRSDGAHYTMEDGVDEDRVISYRVNDIHVYAIFDGHDGSKASQFAAQQFPLELLLGQLEAPIDDEEMRTVIRNAFHMVEEKFFDGLEDKADSLNLNRGRSSLLASSSLPDLNSSFTSFTTDVAPTHIPQHFAGGTTAVMAVYCHGKLFFANCGDSIAVWCQVNADGVLSVHPVSILHNIDSEDEALRLSLLGLDVNLLKRSHALKLTRCVGNYALKKYYRSFDILKQAVTTPITCDPEIIGGIAISPVTRGFVYLMSSGLHQAWKECTDSESVETDIAGLIAVQLSSDKSLHDIAQTVLEQVCQRHAAAYASGKAAQEYFRRDEMTLLIRNFGLDGKDVVHSPTPTSDVMDLLNGDAPEDAQTLRLPGRSNWGSENTESSDDTEADGYSNSLPSGNAQRSLDGSVVIEYVDPYVDFSELNSLDTDFECSDSD